MHRETSDGELSSEAASSGAVLGGYRILERLATRGPGSCYIAEDSELSRKVALEVLPRRLAETEQLVEAARLAASINHPNIASVYGIGEDEGLFYIARSAPGDGLYRGASRRALSLRRPRSRSRLRRPKLSRPRTRRGSPTGGFRQTTSCSRPAPMRSRS